MRVFDMKRIFFAYWLIVLSILCTFRAFSADLPAFYKAPMFQGMPAHKVYNWATRLQITYSQGSTRNSWNGSERTQPLLSVYGPVDLVKMGVNSEKTGVTATGETKTQWGTAGQNFATVDKKAMPKDGTLDLLGKFQVRELDFAFQQNLFSGFFCQVHLPIKELSLSGVTYKNLGSEKIGTGNVVIDDFIKNKLPLVLQEHGFTSLATPFGASKKSGISDILINAGWQGHKEDLSKMIKQLGGNLTAGILIPVAQARDENRVFALPLGYNNHYGFTARGYIEGSLWTRFLALGIYGGGIMLLPEERDIRMKTDKDQSGWLVLEKGHAKVDQGSLWDIGGYVKAVPMAGFSFLLGCSYTSQEPTTLTVHDDKFLSTYIAAQAALQVALVSKDSIVNSDKRYAGWHTYVLHARVGYEGGLERFSPSVVFFYDYPFEGKYSWKTDLIGGSIGLNVGLMF